MKRLLNALVLLLTVFFARPSNAVYDPTIQRWIQMDPIGEYGGVNLYSFVRNNPVSYVDPWGLTTYVWPAQNQPPGSYNFTATIVNDGSDTVLPAIPWLTDSEGLSDATLELGVFIPIADVGSALLDSVLDLGGDIVKAVADKFAQDLPKPPVNCPAGKPFTQAQKQQILDANRAKNNGQLRSDLSGKPLVPSQKSVKGVTPPPNEGQVDHIFPKSLGGQNTTDNAQVLSRRENAAKGNKYPYP